MDDSTAPKFDPIQSKLAPIHSGHPFLLSSLPPSFPFPFLKKEKSLQFPSKIYRFVQNHEENEFISKSLMPINLFSIYFLFAVTQRCCAIIGVG
jgi:hypothetical protein